MNATKESYAPSIERCLARAGARCAKARFKAATSCVYTLPLCLVLLHWSEHFIVHTWLCFSNFHALKTGFQSINLLVVILRLAFQHFLWSSRSLNIKQSSSSHKMNIDKCRQYTCYNRRRSAPWWAKERLEKHLLQKYFSLQVLRWNVYVPLLLGVGEYCLFIYYYCFRETFFSCQIARYCVCKLCISLFLKTQTNQ